MIGSASLGPFAYFPVQTPTGVAWIRLDQVAAITPYEVIMVGADRAALILADDQHPLDVLAAMRVHIETVGLGAQR